MPTRTRSSAGSAWARRGSRVSTLRSPSFTAATGKVALALGNCSPCACLWPRRMTLLVGWCRSSSARAVASRRQRPSRRERRRSACRPNGSTIRNGPWPWCLVLGWPRPRRRASGRLPRSWRARARRPRRCSHPRRLSRASTSQTSGLVRRRWSGPMTSCPRLRRATFTAGLSPQRQVSTTRPWRRPCARRPRILRRRPARRPRRQPRRSRRQATPFWLRSRWMGPQTLRRWPGRPSRCQPRGCLRQCSTDEERRLCSQRLHCL
mmetsp:Transcript_32807/g.90607  ORF Transcript_32807/g.90607 Transcript_32807/m.90607 type:complete len:264 (-) Transcript_32807:239-1030(-)